MCIRDRGLAIVKHVLNRHEGRLEIVSEPGEGSSFTVWLQRSDTHDAEEVSLDADETP